MTAKKAFNTYHEFYHEVFRRNKSSKWEDRAEKYLPATEYNLVCSVVRPLAHEKQVLKEQRAALDLTVGREQIDTLTHQMKILQGRIRDLYKSALMEYGTKTLPIVGGTRGSQNASNKGPQQAGTTKSGSQKPSSTRSGLSMQNGQQPLAQAAFTNPTPALTQNVQHSQQLLVPGRVGVIKLTSTSHFGKVIAPAYRERLVVPWRDTADVCDPTLPHLPFSPFVTLDQSGNPWYPQGLLCADFAIKDAPAAIIYENIGSAVLQIVHQGSIEASIMLSTSGGKTEVPLSAVLPPAPVDFHAWFFNKPGQDHKFLVSGLFNNLIFGLAPSVILESIYRENPSAFAILPGFGLQNYIIDMGQMRMVNAKRQEEIWEVSREKVNFRKHLPPSWMPMMGGAEVSRAIVVPLAKGDPQLTYVLLTIPSHFELPGGSDNRHAVDIIRIYAVQNPRLDQLFKIAGEDLREQYIKYPEVHFRTIRAFHGTSPCAIASICEKNFDWRRSGEGTGRTSYGKGCYFGPFAISHFYSSPAVSSVKSHWQTGCRRFMFVADIHVGLQFLGNPGIVYPPEWKNGLSYDTAVDKLENPSIYVKFDKNHVMPRFIIEYAVAGIDD